MVLSIKNLSVCIEHKNILHDLFLSFAEGKRTAIIGPNGAGKSTLLKVMSGLNSSYEGDVFLGNKNIRKFSSQQLAQRIAILPQGATAPPDVTVKQLVEYGRFPYRSWFYAGDADQDRAAVAWAMQVTHMERFAGRQVQTLSGGERQRAFFAMVLAQKTNILLLDEPTAYLDVAHQLEVMEIVQTVNEKYGMTVIMVLHDINHALQYADELIVLDNHEIVAQGKSAKILTADLLARVFRVRADVFKNSQGAAVLSPIGLIKE